MKIKVIKGFIDKMTDEETSAGEVIEREEERAKEIVGAGFAEEIEEKQEEKEHEEAKKGREEEAKKTPTKRQTGTK